MIRSANRLKKPVLLATSALFACLALGLPAVAATEPTATVPTQTTAPSGGAKLAQANETGWTATLETALTLRADRTAETVETRRIKILTESALENVGQQMVSHVEGMQILDVVEAYTEKADGRKIEVDPDSIITRDAAEGLNGIYLRDQKVSTILFPDLDVGDTVVLVTRQEDKANMFPGQFYHASIFLKKLPFTTATIKIAAPREVPLSVEISGSGFERQAVEQGEMTRYTIRYKHQFSSLKEPNETSPLDRDPHVLVSTFKDYAQLGDAYWAPAASKVKVTPAIQKLADDLTKGIEDRRAQAIAIDQWVKRNIRYVAVYLGAGRFVPNEAASVLKNKYGDCKDHAALMTALLSAKGIASEHVLVNLGDVYSLPETVSPNFFNHAMIYLPEFDLYDDPTAGMNSFGVLAPEAYDKPVVRTSGEGSVLARTPVMRAEDHTTTNRTQLTIGFDGSVRGTTKQTATGVFALSARMIATQIQKVGSEAAAERLLGGLGTPGKGKVEYGSLKELADAYVISSQFVFSQNLKIAPGGKSVIPTGLAIHKRPGEFLLSERVNNRQHSFLCMSGRQIEEIELTFAEGLPMPLGFNDRKLEKPLFTYTSEYRFSGRTLKVKRVFEAHVPGQVCSPADEDEIAESLNIVRGSMNTTMAFAAPPKPKLDEPKPEAAKPEAPKPDRQAAVEPAATPAPAAQTETPASVN